MTAESLINSDNVRQIEDGPYGGTRLTTGDELIGEVLTTPDNMNGETWGAVRSADFSVAQGRLCAVSLSVMVARNAFCY